MTCRETFNLRFIGLTTALLVVASLAVGCGNIESKDGVEGSPNASANSGGFFGNSGNGSTNNFATNNVASNNNPTSSNNVTDIPPANDEPMGFSPDLAPTGDGAHGVMTTVILDLSVQMGRIVITDDTDTCGTVPPTCDSPPTGEGYVIAFDFLAGGEGIDGTYTLGPIDEEELTTETRNFQAVVAPWDPQIEAPSYGVTDGELQISDFGGEIGGEYSIVVDGVTLQGSFFSGECSAVEASLDC